MRSGVRGAVVRKLEPTEPVAANQPPPDLSLVGAKARGRAEWIGRAHVAPPPGDLVGGSRSEVQSRSAVELSRVAPRSGERQLWSASHEGKPGWKRAARELRSLNAGA